MALIGFIFLITCTYLFGQVPHDGYATVLFYALRIGQGIGGTIILTCTNATLADAFPATRGLVMGASELAAGLGWCAGPAFGGLLYTWGGFSFPFTVLSCMLALQCIPCLLLWPSARLPDVVDGGAPSVSSRLGLLAAPGLQVTMVSQVVLMSAWCAFDLGFTAWLSKAMNFDTLDCSLYFAIAPMLYSVVSFPVGWLCDKVKSKKLVIAFGFIGQALTYGAFAPLWQLSPVSIAVLLALNGICGPLALVPALPDMLATIKVEDEDSINCMSTYYSTAVALGSIVGPLQGAFLIDWIGYQWMMFALAALEVLVLIWLLLTHRSMTRLERSTSPDLHEQLLT
eukprot:TRINITY_DN35424_c0_g1_i3.p1 TRINITY_DN35424_c0_g1~~TRINITY_DN35424_c0_g1_i3.p1  ORF type:complete len:341 (+),score=35.39 TRINITY_DN35424_c0_g1_i3:215-1237(+)